MDITRRDLMRGVSAAAVLAAVPMAAAKKTTAYVGVDWGSQEATVVRYALHWDGVYEWGTGTLSDDGTTLHRDTVTDNRLAT